MPDCFSFSPLSPFGASSVVVDLVSSGSHKIVIGGTSEGSRIVSNRNDRKEPGQLRGSNQIFCSLQLPVKVLECVAEIILLFGDQGRISEPVYCSDKTTHHHARAK